MDQLKKLNYLLDKKAKQEICLVFILILMGSLAELAGVVVILPIVNLATNIDITESTWCNLIIRITGLTDRKQILLLMVVLSIVIYILKNTYLSWMYSRLYRISAKIKRQLATKLMEAYLVQPYSFFLKHNTSELIRNINQDTGQLYEVVLNCLLVLSNGLTALAMIITLIVTSPLMTLLVVILLGICAGFVFGVVQKRTRNYGIKNQQLSAFLIKYLQQTFEGVKEIKILNSEKHFIDHYNETYYEQTETSKKYHLVNLIPKYMIEMVCIAGIMGYFALNIIFNQNYLSLIPQLATFVAAAYKLLPSVNAIYAYTNTIVYLRASIDLVYRDIKEANELDCREDFYAENIKKMQFRKSIALSEADFNYENNEKKVLVNASLVVPYGSSVALIGPSGGGKTTTADILIGLLTPTNGKVLVDDVDIRENLEGWRKCIGYIPQSIYLTDGTIKENVALGVSGKEIDEERIWKALEGAQLKEFVQGLEKGIDTEVGERGARISGGQRQRIGIARALYRDPDVLVFDEATSALDNATEKEVMKAIDGLHGTKTMIMIAHRLSTIENCDIVYRVENGQIVKER